MVRSTTSNCVEVLFFRRPFGLPIGERELQGLQVTSREAELSEIDRIEPRDDRFVLLVMTPQMAAQVLPALSRLGSFEIPEEYFGILLIEGAGPQPSIRERKALQASPAAPLMLGDLPAALSFHQLVSELNRAIVLLALRASSRVLKAAANFREIEARSLNEVGRAMMERIPVGDLTALILEKALEATAADFGCLLLQKGLFAGPTETGMSVKLLRSNVVEFSLERLISRSTHINIQPRILYPEQSAFTRVLMEWGGGISWAADRETPEFIAGGEYRIPPVAVFDPDLEYNRSQYELRSWAAFPIRTTQQEILGILLLGNKRHGHDLACDSLAACTRNVTAFSAHDLDVIETLVHKAGMSVDNSRLIQETKLLFESFMSASTVAIESRDPATRGHGERVGVLSVALAEAVNQTTSGTLANCSFTPEQLYELKYASILHDFGKISIDESILRKGTKLHDSELEAIHQRFIYLKERFAKETYRRVLLGHSTNGTVPHQILVAQIEREIEDMTTTLDGYWKDVLEANRPNVVAAGDYERIRAMEHLRIPLAGDEEMAILTHQEVEKLCVRRGSLSPAERRQIESHVEKAYKYLTQIPWSKDLANVPFIIYCHHERENGSGYPRGIRSNEIPIGAKIMAIADVFDALVAVDRPYKRPIPFERAISIMQDEVDEGKLEPELFQLFVERRLYEREDLYPEAMTLMRQKNNSAA